MDTLESFEAKLFFKVYMLYKNNLINEYQRGRIKGNNHLDQDMIILRDARVEAAMNQYLTDQNEWQFIDRLQTCSNEECSPRSPFLSDDCFSNKSSGKYRNKRPAHMNLPMKNFMISQRKYLSLFTPGTPTFFLTTLLKDTLLAHLDRLKR